MSVIDRAKSHFESLGTQSMEVPEWKDDDGNPTVIYWNPITLAEKKRLFQKSDNLNDVGILADIILMKAIDKDGKKLFTLEDKIPLMHKVDSDVLAKVATQIIQTITPDEVKKKLNSDPELKNLLIVADRLKITLSQLLKMEVWEYNHWLGYFMLENEEQEKQSRIAKHGTYK